MNLSQIEVIVEIARAGSISKAAQNLYISQPGVSKILQKFEEEVGVQIFERGSTGVRLTPIGRRFVDNAQDVIDQAGKLEELFGSKSTSLTMELSVAAMSYHFMQRLLPEIYHKYCQNSINIRYIECGFDDELKLINKGDVEIGLVSFWQPELRRVAKRAQASGVEYHRLGNVRPYIGVSRDSKAYPASVQGIDLKRLASMPIVSISPSSPFKTTGWDFVRQLFGKTKLEASNREICTTSTGTMREMVCQTDGFSLILINDGIRRRYGFFDDIRLIPVPGDDMHFEMGWLQRSNTVRSPLANDFVTMLGDFTSEG